MGGYAAESCFVLTHQTHPGTSNKRHSSPDKLPEGGYKLTSNTTNHERELGLFNFPKLSSGSLKAGIHPSKGSHWYVVSIQLMYNSEVSNIIHLVLQTLHWMSQLFLWRLPWFKILPTPHLSILLPAAASCVQKTSAQPPSLAATKAVGAAGTT